MLKERTKGAKPMIDLRFQTLTSPFLESTQTNTLITDSRTSSPGMIFAGSPSLQKRTPSLQIPGKREKSPLKNEMLRKFREHSKVSSPEVFRRKSYDRSNDNQSSKPNLSSLLKKLDNLRTENTRLREEFAFVETLKEALKLVECENKTVSSEVPPKLAKAMLSFKNLLLKFIN